MTGWGGRLQGERGKGLADRIADAASQPKKTRKTKLPPEGQGSRMALSRFDLS
jgi:hypothetical protein